MKYIGAILLMLGSAALGFAGALPAPEIDVNAAGSALALIAGGLYILRSRNKK